MSISNFIKDKVDVKEEKSVNDLKKFRKPVKFIKFKNKVCEFCGKNKFLVCYKKDSEDVLAYKCNHCGNSILAKEKAKKVVKKEVIKQLDENVEFKCLAGGIEYCIFEKCSFYGNICKLIKK